MTAPDYNSISDVELAPGKPITSSLLTRLRDGLLSVIGGGLNAPLIERLAVSAGGTGTDGGWVNGTVITGPGYFEPSSIVFSSVRTLPGICVARVSGNVSISAAVSLTGLTTAETRAARYALRSTGGDDGEYGASGSTCGGAGAGAIGDGGVGSVFSGSLGAPGLGVDMSTFRWGWLSLNPRPGGHGGDGYANGGRDGIGGNAGGSLIMLIEGDCDLTGGTLSVDGGAGANGASGAIGAGAGAGSIIILCTGTLTSGTFHARGGAGAANGGGTLNTGGGGGGYVALVASAFAGARTYDVSGGVGPNGAADGTAGYHETATLTAAQIRGLMFRSY